MTIIRPDMHSEIFKRPLSGDCTEWRPTATRTAPPPDDVIQRERLTTEGGRIARTHTLVGA